MARKKQFASKDKNHDAIKEAFEKQGFRVFDSFHVGDDFPDQVVTTFNGLTIVGAFSHDEVKKALESIPGLCVFEGAVFLVEVKNPETGYGKQGLQPGQLEFSLQHPVHKVERYEDVDVFRPEF